MTNKVYRIRVYYNKEHIRLQILDLEIQEEKLKKLEDILRGYRSVAVAFSGGVDSTFLLAVAHDVLGEKCIALTADSASFPMREHHESAEFCREKGIRQIFFESEEMDDADYVKNPKNRCYYCKQALFSKMKTLAEEQGIHTVVEGSNMDDLGDYRPGLEATKELAVKSPLREAGFTKEEIRSCSKEMDLPTWDKPSFACLASRVPYGEQITQEKLKMVERAEDVLSEVGLTQFRVRIHRGGVDRTGEDADGTTDGKTAEMEKQKEQSLHEKIAHIRAEHEQETKNLMARIEILPEEFDIVMKQENRQKIVKALKEAGFAYVTLDLEGYRMGSMNRGL